MNPDPVLEGLIAAGAFAVAADRYEEETGDTELAALMRIPGLEWELVDGKPGLRMQAHERIVVGFTEYDLVCGSHDFGMFCVTMYENNSLPELVSVMLANSDLSEELTPLLSRLVDEAMKREWK